jgi:hypothetical protein
VVALAPPAPAHGLLAARLCARMEGVAPPLHGAGRGGHRAAGP